MVFSKLQNGLKFIKVASSAMKLMKDPSQTDSVFDIVDSLLDTEAAKASFAYLKAHPDLQPLIAERYIAGTPNLDELLTLPPESLGYIYASKMKASNFDPEFYRKVKIETDENYILLRVRQTHDIWHMVTGFDTDSNGEVGLQAFGLAQLHWPLAVMIISGSLFSAIKEPEKLTPTMNAIQQGYQIGIESKLFLAQKWEENWDKPLNQWRSELNVNLVLGS